LRLSGLARAVVWEFELSNARKAHAMTPRRKERQVRGVLRFFPFAILRLGVRIKMAGEKWRVENGGGPT
jgi:hypothetical protein